MDKYKLEHISHKNPIKVLNIVYGLGRFGGIESFLMQYYSHMDHSKVHFDFLFLTMNTLESLKDNPILIDSDIQCLGALKIKGNNLKDYLRLKKKLNEYIKDKEYDVIHIHTGNVFGQAWLAVFLQSNSIRVAHSHSTNRKLNANFKDYFTVIIFNILKRIICYRNNYLLSCSNMAGEALFGKRGIKNNKYQIIKNAIDVKQYVFNSSKREIIRKNNNLQEFEIYGFVGRLSSEKNIDFLIEVFYEIHKNKRNTFLWIIGDGNIRVQLEYKIKKLGIVSSVYFWGERKDVPDLLQAMDALIMPSLYEGLSLVAIEAQAASLPVFASDSISKEHRITELIHFISLQLGQKIWAKKIIGYMNYKPDRINRTSQLEEAGYEINCAAKKYEAFYQEIV